MGVGTTGSFQLLYECGHLAREALGSLPVKGMAGIFVDDESGVRKCGTERILILTAAERVALSPHDERRGGNHTQIAGDIVLEKTFEGGAPDTRGHLQAFLDRGVEKLRGNRLRQRAFLEFADECRIDGVARAFVTPFSQKSMAAGFAR